MKAGTVVAIIVGVGAVGAVGYYAWQRRQGAQATSQSSSTSQQSIAPAAAQANPYEGKLIRVGRKDVYLVKDGVERYVAKLPLADGRGWPVDEVPNHVAIVGAALNLQTLKGLLTM